MTLNHHESRRGYLVEVTWTLSVFLLVLAGIARAEQEPKVEICHNPPGNPSNYHTIKVKANALAAHLGHGDFVGPCENNCVLFSTLCDDGNACTADACNPQTGECQDPIWKDCDDGDPCTLGDACDPANGDCINTYPAGAECDDGDFCTANDVCLAEGGCGGTPIVGCCDSNADCDDSNPCTVDACSLGTHTCAHADVVCDDGDDCTVDACNTSDGACVYAQIACSDCQSCSAGLCVTDTSLSCDDGDLCTVNDSCVSGTCEGDAVACLDDGDACTVELCDPEIGCTEIPLACDDGNPCTVDACDPDDGCLNSADPACCESDADCPGQCWSCIEGSCVVEALVPCDDGNSCTTGDSCTSTGSCVGTNTCGGGGGGGAKE
jgi:hypothetical protein